MPNLKAWMMYLQKDVKSASSEQQNYIFLKKEKKDS